MENIVVLGFDGYIGTALTQRLLKEGYNVLGIDSCFRRKIVKSEGSHSALPELSFTEKCRRFRELGKGKFYKLEILEEEDVFKKLLIKHNPSTIINLAHQPSGPFSMKDADHSRFTLTNNIMITDMMLWYMKQNRECHYITIGSTGCYSHYANIDIEEGYFKCTHKGRTSEEMIYPRRPTSIYHASKVASTYLVDYCTRMWNLYTTDVMQAVVYGTYTPEIDYTKIYSRFDTDECFGTVVNRFIAQTMMKKPMTIFGEGNHKRGFIALNDSVQALMIAIKNRPICGKARVWNQLSEWKSINDIANTVCNIGESKLGLELPKPEYIPSPRQEITTDHYYHYVTDILPSLGYIPTRTMEQEIEYTMTLLKDIDLSDLEKNIIPKIQF